MKHANVTALTCPGKDRIEKLGKNMWKQGGNADSGKIWDLLQSVIDAAEGACQDVFGWDGFQPYLEKNVKKPDLVIYSIFMTDCILYLPWMYDVPYAMLSPAGMFGILGDHFGLYQPPSFVPVAVTTYTHQMDFKERLINTLMFHGFNLISYVTYDTLGR